MSEIDNCWSRNDLLDRISRLQREKTKDGKIDLESLKKDHEKKRINYQKHLSELDQKLSDLGLDQRPIGADGNCFYLALSDQLKRHNIIPSNYDFTEDEVFGIRGQYPLAAKRCRFDLVLHMARNNNDFRLGYNRRQFAAYLQNMRKDRIWAGGQEIAAASDFYNVCIECYSVSSDGLNIELYRPRKSEDESEEDWEKRCGNLQTLRLCLHGNHFWSTRTHEETQKENLNEKIDKDLEELQEEYNSDSDSDSEEIVCKVLNYKGSEYLLGISPESEKNKVFKREFPNDYVGYLKTKKNNEKYIDFSVKED